MARELMNEAERFLLANWCEAQRLEESMDRVRTIYEGLFQRVAESLSDAYQLDDWAPHLRWKPDGCIGFGKKAWPQGDPSWPPGFWLGKLKVDDLCSEESDSPYAVIWIASKILRSRGIELDKARTALMNVASTKLNDEDRRGIEKGMESEVLIEFSFPSKREMRELLLAGDDNKFVGRVVKQFDVMAQFIPALDGLFNGKA